MKSKPIVVRVPGADYQFQVLGAKHAPLRDFYHLLLRQSWTATFGWFVGTFLGANAVFACGYLVTGGIAHARAGSFLDAFFFSAQTMGTIGYGSMYPDNVPANVLMVLESMVGVIFTALVTGLMFARFSRSTARLVFSREAVVYPMAGVPTLSFRMGNERSNQIVDTQIRVVLVRTETMEHGGKFYRMYDVPLTRGRALSLSRSWTAFHQIDPSSPFHGQTPETLRDQDVEVQIMVVGLDDTSMQTVHASHRYDASRILFGARHVDILSEAPSGDITLDLRKFDDVVVTQPTREFPYPAS